MVQILQIGELFQLRFKNLLNTEPALPLRFDRFARRDVAHADSVGMNWNLPDPLHIRRSRAVGVEGGALDGFRNGEVVPHRPLVWPVSISCQPEYPGEQGRPRPGGIRNHGDTIRAPLEVTM